MKTKRHFTLVEIMIVVAIIGILAVIGAPVLLKAIGKSKRSTCIANLRQIETAKERALMDNVTTFNAANLYGAGKYIKTEPKCPSGGTYTIGAYTAPVAGSGSGSTATAGTGASSPVATCSFGDGHEI